MHPSVPPRPEAEMLASALNGHTRGRSENLLLSSWVRPTASPVSTPRLWHVFVDTHPLRSLLEGTHSVAFGCKHTKPPHTPGQSLCSVSIPVLGGGFRHFEGYGALTPSLSEQWSLLGTWGGQDKKRSCGLNYQPCSSGMTCCTSSSVL